MKKLIAIVLAVVMIFALGACGQKQDEPQEVIGATLLYAKQYYAFRVGQYSATSTYSKNVTVYEEGIALAELLQNAELTELQEEFSNCWGYRVQFYTTGSEKIEPQVYITVDGRLHVEEKLYQIENPDEILNLLAEAVKPTNLDSVTK